MKVRPNHLGLLALVGGGSLFAMLLLQCVSDATGPAIVFNDGGPVQEGSSPNLIDGSTAPNDAGSGNQSDADAALVSTCIFIDAGPHGALDPQYNNQSFVLADGSGLGSTTTAAAIDKHGRVYLAYPRGNCIADATHPSSSTDYAVARLDETGHLDTSFGTSGYACAGSTNGSPTNPADRDNEDIPYAITIDDQERVVVAGESVKRPSIVRFTSAGVPDPSFGFSGGLVSYYSGSAFIEEAGVTERRVEFVTTFGSQILLVGSANAGAPGRLGFAVIVKADDGTIDPTFKPDGVTSSFRSDYDVVAYHGAQVVGSRILLAVTRSDGSWVVRAIKTSGQLDPTFGTGGDSTIPDAGSTAWSLVGDDSGVLVAGPDHTFGGVIVGIPGNGGALQTSFNLAPFQWTGNYAGIARGCDGRLVSAGTLGQFVVTGDSYPFLLGLNGQGNGFDPGFGEAGATTWVVSKSVAGYPAALATSVLVDPRNGKYVLVGTTDDPATLIARFLP